MQNSVENVVCKLVGIIYNGYMGAMNVHLQLYNGQSEG